MTHIQTLELMLANVKARIKTNEDFYNGLQKKTHFDKVTQGTMNHFGREALVTIANATQQKEALEEAIDVMKRLEEFRRKLAGATAIPLEADDVASKWVEIPKDA